jgi:hypothetical protein
MENQNRKYKIEIAQTFIMSAMVLISAWSGYQASAWGGVQSFRLAESSAAGRMASQKALIADNQMLLDGILVANFAHAVIEDKKEVAKFYIEHVPPQLGNVLNAWLATKPLENPDAPADPLAMTEYREKVVPVYYAEVVKWGEEAELKYKKAQQANQTSSEYVFTTVLLSSVLFLGGIVSKLEKERVRMSLLVVAYAFALVTFGLLLTLPIA